MPAAPSLGKRVNKVPNMKPLRFFCPFAWARERISIKMHSVGSRVVIGPSNLLFGGPYVWTFQPENGTGWGTEGVKGYALNPFTAPARTFYGLKSAQKHACKQRIWWTYNNSTSNAVHFGTRPFTCPCEESNLCLIFALFLWFLYMYLNQLPHSHHVLCKSLRAF